MATNSNADNPAGSDSGGPEPEDVRRADYISADGKQRHWCADGRPRLGKRADCPICNKPEPAYVDGIFFTCSECGATRQPITLRQPDHWREAFEGLVEFIRDDIAIHNEGGIREDATQDSFNNWCRGHLFALRECLQRAESLRDDCLAQGNAGESNSREREKRDSSGE